MYIYIQSEYALWTVGFYSPDGQFMPESDHSTPNDAAQRAAWLNGDVGPLEDRISSLEIQLSDLQSQITDLEGRIPEERRRSMLL